MQRTYPKKVIKSNVNQFFCQPSTRQYEKSLGSTRPRFCEEQTSKQKIKAWVCKQTMVEAAMSDFQAAIALSDEKKQPIDAAVVSRTRHFIISVMVLDNEGSLLLSEDIFKIIDPRTRETAINYLLQTGTIQERHTIDLLLSLTRIDQHAVMVEKLAMLQKQVSQVISRLQAYEAIGALLNRAIIGSHAPKAKLLVGETGETKVLSRKVGELDLFTRIKAFEKKKDKPEWQAPILPVELAGFVEALTVRVLLGDKPVDIRAENMIFADHKVVNIDTGSFFSVKYDLVEAFQSYETLLQYVLGGAENEATDDKEFQFFNEVEKPIYTGIPADIANKAINDTLIRFYELDDAEIRAMIDSFRYLPDRSEFLLVRDADWLYAYIQESKDIVRDILLGKRSEIGSAAASTAAATAAATAASAESLVKPPSP